MHPETERTLRIITEIEVEMQMGREKLRKIKTECPHHDYDLAYVETMGFDQTPARVCVVCRIPGYDVTEQERRDLYAEHCRDIEIEFTEADFQKKGKGFNF